MKTLLIYLFIPLLLIGCGEKEYSYKNTLTGETVKAIKGFTYDTVCLNGIFYYKFKSHGGSYSPVVTLTESNLLKGVPCNTTGRYKRGGINYVIQEN